MFGVEHLLRAASLIVLVFFQFVHKEAPGHAEQYGGIVHINGNDALSPCRQRLCHLSAAQ